MAQRPLLHHGIAAGVGFLLSPLSWWNDLFLNIPIAYLFGSAFGIVSKSLFFPALVIGYWLTNLAGMLLLHYGIRGIQNKKTEWGFAQLQKTLLWTAGYTILLVLLIYFQILRLPTEYFQ